MNSPPKIQTNRNGDAASFAPQRIAAAPATPKNMKNTPTPTEMGYQRLLDTIPKSFPDVVHVPESDKRPEHTRASVVKGRAECLRALIQLMRWSGLAIRDAVTLQREELILANGFYRIVTARQKTGTHVSVPIPNAVAEELLTVLNGNPKFFFWTGNGEERTAVSHFQDDLRDLFKIGSPASSGRLHALGEFAYKSLIDLMPPAVFIDVKLGDGDQIVLFVYIETDVAGDAFEQLLPVHQSGRNREAGTSKDRGVLIVKCRDESIDERIDRVALHTRPL